MGHTTPVAITYIDKGLGASILKAGLRLWDGGAENPAAAIKIVRHNLLRPTALVHECGHQVAHIVAWNRELAETLDDDLNHAPEGVADAWSSWASEIAADAFAFVHTGYASVAALHDVLASEGTSVFQHRPGDPHPISHLRVLLGVETCRYFYGAGPWDALAASWTATYPIRAAAPQTQRLVEQSVPLLPRIVRLTLDTPQRAFHGRPLRALIRPERVSPAELQALRAALGPVVIHVHALAVDGKPSTVGVDWLAACSRPRQCRGSSEVAGSFDASFRRHAAICLSSILGESEHGETTNPDSGVTERGAERPGDSQHHCTRYRFSRRQKVAKALPRSPSVRSGRHCQPCQAACIQYGEIKRALRTHFEP